MLTDIKLRSLKPAEKSYKVGDRDGMYVHVAPTGVMSFRLDYRLNGRRETLTIGRYGPGGLSLAEARGKAVDARRVVASGVSPAAEKRRAKRQVRFAKTFGEIAKDWLKDHRMAESTRAMRQSILERDLLPKLGRRKLEEISDVDVRELCERILNRGAPATAVHVRDIVN